MNSLKIATCTGLAWLLAGCNPLMTASIDTFKAAVTGPRPLTLTQAQVDAVPFPQIKVTTVSSEGVMALIRQRGDLQFWVASGKQVLLLRDGLAVRTIGLGVEGDLDGTRLADNAPFKRGLHQVADGFTSQRWIDLYKGQEVGLIVNSRFSRRATQTLHILDKEYTVLRVDERIDVPAIGLRATNHYWVDPLDGFILQSEQQLTTQLRVRIVQLTPDRRHLP